MPFSDPADAKKYRREWKRAKAKARAAEAGLTLQQKIARRRQIAIDAGLKPTPPRKTS